MPLFKKKTKTPTSSSTSAQAEKRGFDPVVGLTAGTVVAAVAVVLLAAFIIYPTIMIILEMQDQIVERQEFLEKLETKNVSLYRAQQVLDTSSDQIDLLSYAIPDADEFAHNLKIIEKTASEITQSQRVGANTTFAMLRLSLSQVPPFIDDFGLPRTSRPYERTQLEYSLSLKGDYQSIEIFLNAIKSSLRNFTIDQITFTAPENRNTSLLDVNLRLSTIYYSM